MVESLATRSREKNSVVAAHPELGIGSSTAFSGLWDGHLRGDGASGGGRSATPASGQEGEGRVQRHRGNTFAVSGAVPGSSSGVEGTFGKPAVPGMPSRGCSPTRDARSSRSTGVCCRGGFITRRRCYSISSRTRVDLEGQGGPGRWNWGLRSAWSRTIPDQAVVEGRRRGGRRHRRFSTQALYPRSCGCVASPGLAQSEIKHPTARVPLPGKGRRSAALRAGRSRVARP